MNQVRATIAGTGLYAPERVIKNEYFEKMYGKTELDLFLRERRNISERRWMSAEQATSDLALVAAEQALRNAGIGPLDLDLIILATDTPDQLSPSTASVLQYKLKAAKAATFDLNSACAGFVTALDTASKFIVADDRYQNILVVGAYAMSKWLNFEEYKVATLFGDGAGAVILQRSKNSSGVLATELYTDGQYHDYLGIYGGGSARPITHEVLEKRAHLLDFAKKIPTEVNAQHWSRLTRSLLERINRNPSEVKKFFMTQINIHSINDTLKELGLPSNRSHNIMNRYGYTGSASVPMALADCAGSHLLKKGDLLMLLASGGGLTMAAAVIEWGYDT